MQGRCPDFPGVGDEHFVLACHIQGLRAGEDLQLFKAVNADGGGGVVHVCVGVVWCGVLGWT